MNLRGELLEWSRRDQAMRQAPFDAAVWHQFDEAATAWFKHVAAEHSWPSRAAVGDEGLAAAWLLAQHSPDLGFQKRCLELLLALPEAEVPQTHIAYLWDRVCIREGRAQRFGTQVRPNDRGQWVPFELEAPEQVDERRRAFGLEPLAEYLKQFS